MNNFIEEYKNALPESVCDFLIKKYEDNIHLAVPGKVGGGIVNPDVKKTMDMGFYQTAVLSKKEYFDTVASITDVLQEKLKEYFIKYAMHRYDVNPKSKDFVYKAIWHRYVIYHSGIHMKKYYPKKDYYKWHVDASHGRPESFARKLVMMFYLNNVDEGGETGFFNQKIEIKPTKGTLVIFPADFTGRHRGLTPKSGVKYIINSWLLEIIEPIKPMIIAASDMFFCRHKKLVEKIAREKYKNN